MISIQPTALAQNSAFTNVVTNDWFAKDVEYVYNNGLKSGGGVWRFMSGCRSFITGPAVKNVDVPSAPVR